MSDQPSELSALASVFDDLPEPTDDDTIEPCRCGLAPDMYNIGQFHMRRGQVVGWCHEYRDLAESLQQGKDARRHADPFDIDTLRLKNRMTLIQVRLDELKRGGCNRP